MEDRNLGIPDTLEQEQAGAEVEEAGAQVNTAVENVEDLLQEEGQEQPEETQPAAETPPAADVRPAADDPDSGMQSEPEGMIPDQPDFGTPETGTADSDKSVPDKSVPDTAATMQAPRKKRAARVKKVQKPDAAPEEDKPEESEVPAEKAPAPKRRPNFLAKEHSGSGRIVSANGQLEAETEEDADQKIRIDLISSLKSKRLLTATIDGVQTMESGVSFVSFLYGGFRGIIPASEVIVMDPEEIPKKGDDPDAYNEAMRGYLRMINFRLTKRIGSEIDFVVEGIDPNPEAKLFTASRLKAMAIKRRRMYLDTDTRGHHVIEVGKIVEGRVVAANQKSLVVDVGGIDCFIPAEEVVYERVMDLSEKFAAGDMVLVKILEIRTGENGGIEVTASAKQARANPFEKYGKFYTVNGKYIGTVTGMSEHGIFVELGGRIPCICKFVGRGPSPVRGSRVTVTIRAKNENGRIFGVISHVSALPR